MGEPSLRSDQTRVHRKIIGMGTDGGWRIYADAQARPFARLKNDDYLGTADICAIFGVSARTVYRWVADELLRWDKKVGREYLFTKGDVLDFYDENKPVMGRPSTNRR